MTDDYDAAYSTMPPTPYDVRCESAARLTSALKSICQTRGQKELAVYILLREIISGPLDREIPIPDPRGSVYGYLVPPRTGSSTRLTPERVAELHRLAQGRDNP